MQTTPAAVAAAGAAESPRHAVERDRARVRLDHAGDDLDQGRLAGAVFAQNRMDPTAPAAEIDVLERAHAAIALGNLREDKKIALRRVRHGWPRQDGQRAPTWAAEGWPGFCRRAKFLSPSGDHWLFFSLCDMICGAVKVTSQGRNWFGAKKFAFRSGQ